MHEEFRSRTFRQTIWGVVSGLNLAARLWKAMFEESSAMPLRRLTSWCRIFFFFAERK